MNQVERDQSMHPGATASGPGAGPGALRGPSAGRAPGEDATDTRPERPRLSIAVPCFNEEASIDAFLDRALGACAPISSALEIVCVDDGSRDGTVARILARRAEDPRIRLIALTRNFGKEAALSAALDHCEGDVVVSIDSDLQHPPELIAEMIEHWRAGWDVVAATRATREDGSFARKLVSRAFYRVFNRISDQHIPADAGDFRLMDRAVIEALRQLPERNRFMKGLFAWVGFRVMTMPYEHADRIGGQSSFNIWKLWNFALDGITAFSTLPLRVWTYMGFTIALIAFLYGSYIIGRTLLFGTNVPGYPSLFTAVLFLGGVQLLSLGVLGEYIGRILVETKQRPIYVVRAAWGVAPAHGTARDAGTGRETVTQGADTPEAS